MYFQFQGNPVCGFSVDPGRCETVKAEQDEISLMLLLKIKGSKTCHQLA